MSQYFVGRRKAGLPASNRTPYGVDWSDGQDVAAKGGSAAWVRKAFDWYLKGVTLAEIAEKMALGAPPQHVRTQRGLVSERNPAWVPARVWQLLRQTRYRGAVVDPALFDAVQRLIRAGRPKRAAKRK